MFRFFSPYDFSDLGFVEMSLFRDQDSIGVLALSMYAAQGFYEDVVVAAQIHSVQWAAEPPFASREWHSYVR
jgi:hypothetical protein